MVFLLFNGGRLGWRTLRTEEVTMPAIVEDPQVVREALPDVTVPKTQKPAKRAGLD